MQAIRKETKDKIDKISDEIIRLQKEATAEAKREARRLQKQKEALQNDIEKYKVRNIINSH